MPGFKFDGLEAKGENHSTAKSSQAKASQSSVRLPNYIRHLVIKYLVRQKHPAMKALLSKMKRRLVSELIRRAYEHSPQKETLLSDIQRWNSSLSIEELFLCTPEFRSLFYYRIWWNRYSNILKSYFPPLSTLYIHTSYIGPGLFIQHGFSTIITAKRIGRNCWINQQVTIGYSNATDCPTIGDDVTISAGAIVIGDVSIGDRVKIGAGAVVVKSVPSDCTVVGNPAYIVRRNGIRVTEKL